MEPFLTQPLRMDSADCDVALDHSTEYSSTAAPQSWLMSSRQWYDCVGVLVHAGTAHVGHNFALLRPNRCGEWVETNDSTGTSPA